MIEWKFLLGNPQASAGGIFTVLELFLFGFLFSLYTVHVPGNQINKNKKYKNNLCYRLAHCPLATYREMIS